MATPLSKALYNWMVGYRAQKGAALTRDDYSQTWGKLGEAVYDWGNDLYARGMGNAVKDEVAFTNMADRLSADNPVGGAVGRYYAPLPAGTTPGAGGVGATFGNLGVDMFDFQEMIMKTTPSQQVRGVMAARFGELGGKVFDWWFNQVQMGKVPDKASYATRADFLAGVTAPGGTAGTAYIPALTPAQQQAEWQRKYDENQQAIYKAQMEGNLAELARANQERERLDREKFALDRATSEAEMAANPRDWIKSWFYQRGQQPPAAAATPGAAPPLAVPPGQIGPPITGPGMGKPGPPGVYAPPGGTVGAVPTGPAAPAPTPPWLSDIESNRRAPAFGASAGRLGTFPIPTPDPNQVSARVFNAMSPSSVAGLEGLASSSGWYWPDYIAQMLNAQQRQPRISPGSVPAFAGF